MPACPFCGVNIDSSPDLAAILKGGIDASSVDKHNSAAEALTHKLIAHDVDQAEGVLSEQDDNIGLPSCMNWAQVEDVQTNLKLLLETNEHEISKNRKTHLSTLIGALLSN